MTNIFRQFFSPKSPNQSDDTQLTSWLNILLLLCTFSAAYVLLIAAVWHLIPSLHLDGGNDKFRDKVFAALLLGFPFLASASCHLFKRFGSSSKRYFSLIGWSLLFGVAAVISLTWSEPYLDSSFRSYVNKWWPGFSLEQIAFASVLTAILVISLLRERVQGLQWLYKIVALITFIIYVFLWLEFPWAIREGTFPPIEEMLSPSAGAFPTINFTAQYINLLGLPIVPFTALFPKASVIIAYIWVDILKVSTLIFSFIFLRHVIDKKWLPLLFVVVVTLPFMSGVHEFYLNNATGYWAVFPFRLVLPAALGALLLWAIRTPPTTRITFMLGVAASIVAWNNTDWGVPAAGGVFLVLLLGTDSFQEAWLRLKYFIAGVASFLILYAVLLKIITGFWVDPAALFYYARVFISNGTISFPMLGWGLHSVVMATFVLTATVGMIGYSAIGKTLYGHRSAYFAALIYAGIFSLGTSLYFINRALLPVLELTFLPWSLCVALLTYGAIRFFELSRNNQAIFPAVFFLTLPVFFLFGVASSSILSGPHIKTEWHRLKDNNSHPWLSSLEPRAAKIERKIQTLENPGKVGLIANNSAAIASLLGIESLTGFWSPIPIADPKTFDQICWAIQRSHISTLLVEPKDVYPSALDKFATCLGAEGKVVWLSRLPGTEHPPINLPEGSAHYQFIPSHEALVKSMEDFPANLPLVEFHIKLNEASSIDGIDIIAPDGLGRWTTAPNEPGNILWGVGIVENKGGLKILNTGPRNEWLNISVPQDLTLWIPDNGNLTKCPKLNMEITLHNGEQLTAFATCE